MTGRFLRILSNLSKLCVSRWLPIHCRLPHRLQLESRLACALQAAAAVLASPACICLGRPCSLVAAQSTAHQSASEWMGAKACCLASSMCDDGHLWCPAGLLALQNAAEGGLSSWSSSVSVHNELLRRGRLDLVKVSHDSHCCHVTYSSLSVRWCRTTLPRRQRAVNAVAQRYATAVWQQPT